MSEENKYDKLKEPCSCGLSKKAIECCYVTPETHDMK